MPYRLSFRLSNTLGRVPPLLRSEATRITSEGLRIGEAAAKGRAPVDTGYLRSSIGVRSTGPYSGALEARADYAVHVEYGTRRMRAQPFMSFGERAARDFIQREWANFERKVPRA
jgi:HK97 gp10 family phage protein